jgi:hypothetical protein
MSGQDMQELGLSLRGRAAVAQCASPHPTPPSHTLKRVRLRAENSFCSGYVLEQLLRPLSARPEVVVDSTAPALALVTDQTTQLAARAGPLGRDRVVSALPLNRNSGTRILKPPLVLRDNGDFVIVDPDGNVIGADGIRVYRMLSATKTIDTRRL